MFADRKTLLKGGIFSWGKCMLGGLIELAVFALTLDSDLGNAEARREKLAAVSSSGLASRDILKVADHPCLIR
jgi:hypothetical protein